MTLLAHILVHTDPVQPSSDEIRAQLDRVLASDEFVNADRMSAFLRYVVERALAGDGDQIKEYAIGVDVFGRNGDYDPRLDSIVRVEARRLRAKVDEYYAVRGCADPVIIRMRRGSYVPSFERRAGPVEPSPNVPGPANTETTPAVPGRRTSSSAWLVGMAVLAGILALAGVMGSRGKLWGLGGNQVSIAVLPFAQYSSDEADRLLAAQLTDGVTSELARERSLSVVSHTSALQFADARRSATEIGRALNANVVMEGRVSRTGDRVGVSIRLVNAQTDRKMWVQDFEGSADDPRELERRIAAEVAPYLLASRPR
jgi:TolB-like protein